MTSNYVKFESLTEATHDLGRSRRLAIGYAVALAVIATFITVLVLLLRALVSQDMFLAGTIVLVYFAIAVIGTLLSDILLAWLDPRIRMET